jgi:hypothetical protein
MIPGGASEALWTLGTLGREVLAVLEVSVVAND